jgi:kynurenine formamidase
LSHVHYDGLLYNGVAASTITMEGAKRHSITATASHFRSRGVLLDIARSRGVPALGESDVITADELENVADAQRVEIRSGDILLIRTGLIGTYHHTGSWERLGMPQPGLHYRVARWLHQRDIAAVAADNTAVEHITPDGRVPLHMLALRDLGMCLGEYWDLEALAADCASDGVYEFFLSAAGLPISGGVGSPVNPIAFK